MLDKIVDQSHPVEIRGITRGADGGLERCAPDLPLRFGFEWQGTKFDGQVARESDRLILSLSAALAQVPFSGENAGRRRDLLALAAATDDDPSGLALSVSKGGELQLKQQIALGADTALTATALVSETTAAVLSSAAVLDLIVESGLIARASGPLTDQPSGTVKI